MKALPAAGVVGIKLLHDGQLVVQVNPAKSGTCANARQSDVLFWSESWNAAGPVLRLTNKILKISSCTINELARAALGTNDQ